MYRVASRARRLKLAAENDGEALFEVAKMAKGRNVEVWEGGRLVAKIDRDKPKAG